MSTSTPSDRIDELSELFVSVTGADCVTESQQAPASEDRELPADIAVDVEDGLEDAVAGADADGYRSDPAL